MRRATQAKASLPTGRVLLLRPSWRSLLHRIALPGILAPEVDAILIGRRALPDILGKQIFHHCIDLAVRQEIVAGGRHVIAHLLAGVAVAALVRVGEAVMGRHAGARPAAFYHLGELLGPELGYAP